MIHKVCNNLIYEAFVEEIIVTIKEKNAFYTDETNLNKLEQCFKK